MWLASEKVRRDKWIQTKEKQIKDNTIKGLEPEIQKMLSVRIFFLNLFYYFKVFIYIII